LTSASGGRALFAALAVLVFIADRVSKELITANVPYGSEREVLPHVWITNTLNAGAAFGVAQNGTPLFLIASVVVAAALVYYIVRNPIGAWTGALLGLIMGGTVGNGYDRVVYHTVTDFVALHWWPVFNVADSAISVGVALLLVGYLVRGKRAG